MWPEFLSVGGSLPPCAENKRVMAVNIYLTHKPSGSRIASSNKDEGQRDGESRT